MKTIDEQIEEITNFTRPPMISGVSEIDSLRAEVELDDDYVYSLLLNIKDGVINDGNVVSVELEIEELKKNWR